MQRQRSTRSVLQLYEGALSAIIRFAPRSDPARIKSSSSLVHHSESPYASASRRSDILANRRSARRSPAQPALAKPIRRCDRRTSQSPRCCGPRCCVWRTNLKRGSGPVAAAVCNRRFRVCKLRFRASGGRQPPVRDQRSSTWDECRASGGQLNCGHVPHQGWWWISEGRSRPERV
jgi:hypothetical protein